MAGAMCGRGTYMAGGAWQGSMYGRGACVAGEMSTAAESTHPNGMHFCLTKFKPFH